MELTCGAKCAKVFLIAFNLIFWVSGCVLIGLGIFMLIDKEKKLLFNLFSDPEGNYALSQKLAWGVIGIGCVVLVVGFCGCCGAIRENRCLLVTYFICLFVIMAAQLTVGILSVVFQDKTISEVEELPTLLKNTYGIKNQETEAIDFAQTKFECCGIFGPEDYDNSQWKQQDLGKGDQVPKTCCVLTNADHLNPKPKDYKLCQSTNPAENAAYRHNEGCLPKLQDFVKETAILFVIVGCSIAALQIFGMVLAMCLCKEV